MECPVNLCTSMGLLLFLSLFLLLPLFEAKGQQQPGQV
jgi:hypothetical protein